MLFGCGKLLIPDVEARATVPHAFSATIQRQLNRSALSQNTVMIDNRDQQAIRETLDVVEFRGAPRDGTVTAVDAKGLLYEGIRQSRTICMRPQYVLDVFQVAMDAEHDISWIIHTIGTPQSQKSSVALKPAKRRILGPGSAWLGDFRAATTDEQIRMEWSEDSVRFALTLAACPETEFMTCGYPTTDEPECPTIPMVLARRRGTQTTYVAVYQAARAPLPKVDIGPAKTDGDRLVLRVTGPWGRTDHDIISLR